MRLLIVHCIKEAHILKEFSLAVKKVLVSQVVSFLLETNVSKVLLSPSHVSWAMETVGEGFCLPIEEAESITKVITLYTTWALEPNKRPTPFNDNPQFFIQVIKHFFSNMKVKNTFYIKHIK